MIERDELCGDVAARFRRVVAAFGDEAALRWEGGSLSYHQLDEASDGLAREILERLGDAEEPVPLRLVPGPEVVVAILGLLKAGKAYVAMDPVAPADYHVQISEQLRARLLLSATGVKTALKLPRLDVDVPRSGTCDAIPLDGERLASVVFTSGSSGRPKGVERTHKALLHRAYVYQRDCDVGPGDVQALTAGAHFSASETDIFGALLSGATLCPYPRPRLDPRDLAEWIDARGITLIHPPASVFRMLAAHLEPGQGLTRVRLVALGGEPVSRSDVALWRERFGRGCQLVHRYSSTEAGNISALVVDDDPAFHGDRLAVGRACPDKTIRIEDRDGRPLPCGEAGEIVVSSPFLSRGYWGLPDLTARVFVSGSCRTGDLGRLSADGLLEHMGRADRQVKVRGFRVELDGTEAALATHPGVSEAAVAERGGRIVAWLVPKPGAPIRGGELRGFLADRLPGPSHPAAFLVVETLPRLSNGKLDRTALSEPARASGGAVGASGAEQALAAVWSDVLGVPGIGPDDDFFELGGDSLRLSVLVERMEALLGLPVDAESFLRDPTIAGILAPPARCALPGWIAVRPDGSLGTWLHLPSPEYMRPGRLDIAGLRRLARELGAARPLFVYCGAAAEPTAPPEPLPDLAQRLASAARALPGHGPWVVSGYSRGGRLALELARCLASAGESVERVVLFDTYGPGFPRQPRGAERFAPERIRVLARETLGRQRDRWRRLWNEGMRTLWRSWRNGLRPRAAEPAWSVTASARGNGPALATLLLRTSFRGYDARGRAHDDETLGWGRVPHVTLGIEEVDAGHGDLLAAAAIGRVGEAIRRQVRTS